MIACTTVNWDRLSSGCHLIARAVCRVRISNCFWHCFDRCDHIHTDSHKHRPTCGDRMPPKKHQHRYRSSPTELCSIADQLTDYFIHLCVPLCHKLQSNCASVSNNCNETVFLSYLKRHRNANNNFLWILRALFHACNAVCQSKKYANMCCPPFSFRLFWLRKNLNKQ